MKSKMGSTSIAVLFL